MADHHHERAFGGVAGRLAGRAREALRRFRGRGGAADRPDEEDAGEGRRMSAADRAQEERRIGDEKTGGRRR